MRNPGKFGDQLTEAIYRIKAREARSLAVIQDELGYLLGKAGEEYLRFLRRGNVPSTVRDLEMLADELVRRGGLEEKEKYRQFLRYGDHPDPEQKTEALFGAGPAGAKSGQQDNQDGTMVADRYKTFVVGPPVTEPSQFFGRERELRRIFSGLRFPLEHTAIIGVRRSGKTSLLHYVRRITSGSVGELRPGQRTDWLSQPEAFQWIWVDFQDQRMQQADGLLRHLLKGLNLPIPEPCTLDSFMDLITTHEQQRPTVVAMDELGAGLASPDLDQRFWWSLRSLLNTPPVNVLAFLVAAHDPPHQLADEHRKPSPFFNMFNTIELGPFLEHEARELIASSPHPFAPDDVSWILEHSGLWPCLLQIFCQERLLALEENEQGEDWKERALQRMRPCRHLLDSAH